MFVDRFMSTAMHYPTNYGYIPHTLSDDGDPCDVLVLSPVPLITGVVVRCRPIGMLKLDDEAGGDARSSRCRSTSCRRCTATCSRRATCRRSRRARSRISSSITRTWSRASGCVSAIWVDAAEAKQEIIDGVARYRAGQAQEVARPGPAQRSTAAFAVAFRSGAVPTKSRRRANASTSPPSTRSLPRATGRRAFPRERSRTRARRIAQLRRVPRRRADRLPARGDGRRDVRLHRRRVRAAGPSRARVGEVAGRHCPHASRVAALRRLLLVTRDAHAVYAHCGFAPLAHPERFMEITDQTCIATPGLEAARQPSVTTRVPAIRSCRN